MTGIPERVWPALDWENIVQRYQAELQKTTFLHWYCSPWFPIVGDSDLEGGGFEENLRKNLNFTYFVLSERKFAFIIQGFVELFGCENQMQICWRTLRGVISIFWIRSFTDRHFATLTEFLLLNWTLKTRRHVWLLLFCFVSSICVSMNFGMCSFH